MTFLHNSRVTSLFDCYGIGHPIYQPCTRFCHRLEASLQQVSPAISTDPIATIYICRFLFLILASKSDFWHISYQHRSTSIKYIKGHEPASRNFVSRSSRKPQIISGSSRIKLSSSPVVTPSSPWPQHPWAVSSCRWFTRGDAAMRRWTKHCREAKSSNNLQGTPCKLRHCDTKECWSTSIVSKTCKEHLRLTNASPISPNPQLFHPTCQKVKSPKGITTSKHFSNCATPFHSYHSRMELELSSVGQQRWMQSSLAACRVHVVPKGLNMSVHFPSPKHHTPVPVKNSPIVQVCFIINHD